MGIALFYTDRPTEVINYIKNCLFDIITKEYAKIDLFLVP